MGIKKAIGIDIDDVKARFNSVLQSWHNRVYGTTLKVTDITDYNLWNVWCCTREEAVRRVHEFYDSPDSERIAPVEGSQEGCLILGQSYDLFSITSRPISWKVKTEQWVQRYFPSTFSGVYLINSFSLDGVKRKKSEVCLELEVKVIVEDSPHVARECYEAGIRVVLLNHPWNLRVELPREIVRVDNWEGIVREVRRLAG